MWPCTSSRCFSRHRVWAFADTAYLCALALLVHIPMSSPVAGSGIFLILWLTELRSWGTGPSAWSLGQTFHLYQGSILLSVRWHFWLFLFHEAVLLCNLQCLFLCSLETICTKVEKSQTIDLFFKRCWFSEVKNHQNPNLMTIMRIICS